MTFVQVEAVILIVAMLAIFIWDRWRYDLVAVCVMLVAVGIGLIPHNKAFDGFSHPVVIIVGSVLVISKAIARSGLLSDILRRGFRHVTSLNAQIAALTASVAFLSAVVKNVGTLGIFMPLAVQTARKSKRSPSLYLMPLSFASLIGGTMTLVGTSPNLLVSSIREAETGQPFRMFDFAYVGLPLTLLTIAFLSVARGLLPSDRTPVATDEQLFEVERYLTELRVVLNSPLAGSTIGQLEQANDDNLVVTALIREGDRQYIPSSSWSIYDNDILIVHGAPEAVEAAMAKGGLELVGSGKLERLDDPNDDLDVVEAVVGADSLLLGETVETLRLRHRYQTNLLAVGRAGRRAPVRMQSHRFQIGDVVLLQGLQKALPSTLSELGCLPLADRNLGLGRQRRGWLSIIILVAAVASMVINLVSAPVAFFGAAVLIVASQQISLKVAYSAIDGPMIVMLAALIPLGDVLKDTGVTEIIAQHLAVAAQALPGLLAVGLMLLVAMMVTPFLSNAPAVLMMGPIAALVAKKVGYSPDPFLMAVALGSACDFLTPIGHQNNLLVMGPGGYRFGDYWRLGLPLSLLVLIVGTPLILWAWPLT